MTALHHIVLSTAQQEICCFALEHAPETNEITKTTQAIIRRQNHNQSADAIQFVLDETQINALQQALHHIVETAMVPGLDIYDRTAVQLDKIMALPAIPGQDSDNQIYIQDDQTKKTVFRSSFADDIAHVLKTRFRMKLGEFHIGCMLNNKPQPMVTDIEWLCKYETGV